MNDEIKEILDKLNKLEYDDIHLIICEVISRREIKILLDYITNLQEENEDLKDRLKVMEHFKNSLQEENEKLKELCDKYEEEHNTAFKLWTMKMEEVPTYEEKMIYKSRCERAIELIKDFENKFKGYAVFPDKRFLDLEELLNILNGGDEEN